MLMHSRCISSEVANEAPLQPLHICLGCNIHAGRPAVQHGFENVDRMSDESKTARSTVSEMDDV